MTTQFYCNGRPITHQQMESSMRKFSLNGSQNSPMSVLLTIVARSKTDVDAIPFDAYQTRILAFMREERYTWRTTLKEESYSLVELDDPVL